MTNKLSCYKFSIQWITIIVHRIVSLTCLKLVRSNIELSNVPWVVEIITILTTILTMSALNAENDDFGDHWWSKHLGSSELSASFFVTCNTLLASLQYVFWCFGLKIQNAKYLLLFVFVFDVLDWTFEMQNIYCSFTSWWVEPLESLVSDFFRVHEGFFFVARMKNICSRMTILETAMICLLQFRKPQCGWWGVNVYEKGRMFRRWLLHPVPSPSDCFRRKLLLGLFLL